MDLSNFFERNFEKEGLSEDRNNEINKLFDNIIRETPKTKKGFSVREFLMEMDDSDPEWREESDDEMDEEEIEDGEIVDGEIEDGEIENTEPIPMADPIPIFEEFEEEELEEGEIVDFQQMEENIEADDVGDENLDPAQIEFNERVRSFPAAIRQETKICKICHIPYSRKSLKRHLFDIHEIDDPNWEDYCEQYTVLPEFKKLELNKKDGLPQVKVRFSGKKNRTKNDVFPTKHLWGLKSFRKYVRNVDRNGSKKQKKIVQSDQMKREKKSRKVAFTRFGKYAQDKKYECSICKKRKRAFNASVFCHSNDDNQVPHTFCTPCVTKWTTLKGQKCPLCRESGVAIKIYHNE